MVRVRYAEKYECCQRYKWQVRTDLFTEEGVDIISHHNVSEPLFLYLSHLAVHSGNPSSPLQAPTNVVNKFSYIKDKNRRIFAGMLWKFDESVVV